MQTTNGRSILPLSVLTKVPVYIPPLSQIVSPAFTTVDGLESPTGNDQGLVKLPLPEVVPALLTYQELAEEKRVKTVENKNSSV